MAVQSTRRTAGILRLLHRCCSERALLSAASGSVTADPLTLGALEVCAGTWARAFASATVEPQTAVSAAVTPGALATIARNLIRRGESMHQLDVADDGRVELVDVGHWDMRGSVSRRDWFVRADVHGPDVTTTRTVPYAGALHLPVCLRPVAAVAGRLAALMGSTDRPARVVT